MQKWSSIFKQLSMLSQFGLSLLTPTLLCLLVCWWLTAKLGLGAWIYIPGFILGLGSSFMTAWKFYVKIMSANKKLSDDRKDKHFFNSHM